jgi:hypothetical protein
MKVPEMKCTVTRDDAMEFVADYLENTEDGKNQVWELRRAAIVGMLLVILSYFYFVRSFAWSAALVIFAAILIYRIKYILIGRYKSEYKKPHLAGRFGPVEYQINADGITKANNGIKMSFEWKTLKCRGRSKNQFWIKAEGNNLLIFPRRDFQLESEFNQFIDELQAKINAAA